MTGYSGRVVGLLMIVATLSGCDLADQQMAYRRQQRQDCVAAGGFFTDNYTCEGLRGAGTSSSPPAPMKCRKQESTVTKDDGTTVTSSTEVCSGF